MFNLSTELVQVYPEAHIGVLVMRGVENPSAHPLLEDRKREVENQLKARYAGIEPGDLDTTYPLSAYSAYYKRFDKTYHVAGQLKPVVFKDKPIPSVASLVETMFIAELKNGLLTAGHDLDQVTLPLTANVANGTETYTVMRGAEQTLKPGDMYIADARGILSSILYGPDQRTQINPQTQNVLFTVYAPHGITETDVDQHLLEIKDLVMLVSPQARLDSLVVLGSH